MSDFSPAKAQKPVLRRAILSAVLIPVFSIALFISSHAYVIYAHNRAADAYHFPAEAPPIAGESVLVVSPHPDDETLATSGMMQDAISRGVPVHVVFLTYGDAFRVGVARYFREWRTRSSDFVKYGEMREGEARGALGSIGVPAANITFLGYPDQGMLPIWRSHWSSSDPFTSHYTHVSHVPYPDAYRPGSAYCGQSVVNDLASLIEADHPTDIYVTHPSDDHPDHSAAPAFVDVALNQLVLQGQTWAAGVRVHYYMVHRGDWPVPQGLEPGQSLAPPAPMISLDTRWRSLRLTPLETDHKLVALEHYASQQEMMQRFLTSFVRTNEIFGSIPDDDGTLPVVPDDQITVDGDSQDWPLMSPLIEDPVGDSVLRAFQSSADLRAVYACVDSRYVYFRIDCEKALSPQIQYTLYVRAFDDKQQTVDNGLKIIFTPNVQEAGLPTLLPHGVKAAYNNSTLEIAVPRSYFGVSKPDALYVEAATLFSQVIVDRTGIRCGHIPASRPPSAPLS